jgi:hypothetical protein
MGVSWKVIGMVRRAPEVLSLAELELEPLSEFVLRAWLLRSFAASPLNSRDLRFGELAGDRRWTIQDRQLSLGVHFRFL